MERLRAELEDKIKELGPETVIGCKSSVAIGCSILKSLVVAETVVGATTGAVPAPKGYFAAMKSVCDKFDIWYMLDEVMCGMGRKYLGDCQGAKDYLCLRHGNFAFLGKLWRRYSP